MEEKKVMGDQIDRPPLLMKCIVKGCEVRIPLDKGCACGNLHHKNLAGDLIASFEAGIPTADINEWRIETL